MAKNELFPFANGEDANVLPTNQWEALTDILENGFQSGIARSEQVNRVLAQGALASYVLGQLIVDRLNKDAALDKNALYQDLILALQENAKDVCLPLSGGTMTGNIALANSGTIFGFKDGNFIAATMIGGNPNYPNGAFEAFASNSPLKTGGFTCRARGVNGEVYDLDGVKDRLTWCGNDIFHRGNVADFVVEQWGDSGAWYRKWNSGKVDQVFAVSVPANGVAHEFDLLVPLQGYWNTQATIDRKGDEGNAILSVYAGRSDDNSKVAITIDRYDTLNNYTFYVFVYASGVVA